MFLRLFNQIDRTALGLRTVDNIDRQDEFMQQFRQCQRDLLAYILAIVPRHADAQDILQETAAALWQKFDQYDPARSFAGWAQRFAHIEICKHRDRGRYRRWMLNPFDEQLLEALAAKVHRNVSVVELRDEALLMCMKQLTAAEYDLLHQYYWGEQSVQELATEIGLSERQLYRRLHTVRQALKRCIDQRIAEVGA